MNNYSLLMNTMLPKNRFKILNFLVRSLEVHNINQIARILNLSVGSVHKILKDLEKRNIVIAKKLGNAIYYSINFNNESERILSAIILMEDKNNRLNENRLAKVYASDLEKFDSKLIMLFGSILTKKYQAKDVDVLFIIKNKEQVKEINEFCLEISKIRPKNIHPLIMLEQDFIDNLKNKNKAIIDLVKGGTILKGEEVFVRCMKNAR